MLGADPADLVQDVMRLPYRQRFTLIVNELGAAAAARSGDLQAALQRAVPALTETDNLLSLLGNDSTTLQNLTVVNQLRQSLGITTSQCEAETLAECDAAFDLLENGLSDVAARPAG